MSQIPTVSETSKFRNNERKNADARRSLKHEVLKVNVAFSDFLILIVIFGSFASRQMNKKKKETDCHIT